MEIIFIANSGKPMNIADGWTEQIDTSTLRVLLTTGETKQVKQLTDTDIISVPLLCDHETKIDVQAGTVTSLKLDDNNQLIATAVLNSTPAGQLVQTLTADHDLKNSFSVSISVNEYSDLEPVGDVDNPTGVIYHNALITEISVVWCGADQYATLLNVKE